MIRIDILDVLLTMAEGFRVGYEDIGSCMDRLELNLAGRSFAIFLRALQQHMHLILKSAFVELAHSNLTIDLFWETRKVWEIGISATAYGRSSRKSGNDRQGRDENCLQHAEFYRCCYTISDIL